MRLALLLALLPLGAAAQDCAPGSVDVRGGFGAARFAVEVADDPEERAQGLMFVEALGPMEGMLFVYEREADGIAFWMKNTLIPLDMIFASGDGTIVRVHENAVPGDLTPIPAGAPTRFVLELRGGRAGALGIEAGDTLRHPSIPGSCAGEG